mmetsp:Transcript_17595/g.61894  ORF Transcript_17595/g.61894 Transcript_17595/m.61894 type:complete len:203 (+) Transcript_17595:1026-1634(+)
MTSARTGTPLVPCRRRRARRMPPGRTRRWRWPPPSPWRPRWRRVCCWAPRVMVWSRSKACGQGRWLLKPLSSTLRSRTRLPTSRRLPRPSPRCKQHLRRSQTRQRPPLCSLLRTVARHRPRWTHRWWRRRTRVSAIPRRSCTSCSGRRATRQRPPRPPLRPSTPPTPPSQQSRRRRCSRRKARSCSRAWWRARRARSARRPR